MSIWTKKSSNWKIASVGSGGFAAAVGAGVNAFQIYSPEVTEVPVEVYTIAIGVGGGAWGASTSDVPDTNRTNPKEFDLSQFKDVDAVKPFSLADLDRAYVKISGGGFTQGVGLSFVILNVGFAFIGSGLFEVNIFGPEIGLAKGMYHFRGMMIVTYTTDYRESQNRLTRRSDVCSIYDVPAGSSLDQLTDNIKSYPQGPSISRQR